METKPFSTLPGIEFRIYRSISFLVNGSARHVQTVTLLLYFFNADGRILVFGPVCIFILFFFLGLNRRVITKGKSSAKGAPVSPRNFLLTLAV